MPSKLAAVGLLAIALLQAQEVDDLQHRFVARIDDALGVHPGAVIADIGTGRSIAQPLRIAEGVGPGGKVVCVDIQQSVIAEIKKQIGVKHVTNIEAVLGTEDDPLLAPRTFDRILVSYTYHEFTQPAQMLHHIHNALKPGGKLVIAEFYSTAHSSEPRADQTKRHDMAPDILERELSAAGFVIKERIGPILLEKNRFRYGFSAEAAAR